MSVSVRESSMPGIGQRYEIDLSSGRQLVVIAGRDGVRTVGIVNAGDDAPAVNIELAPDQAVMVGALLLGARFSIDASADERTDANTVMVDTVTVSPDAPSIGRTPSTVFDEAHSYATILAVISDQTPELIEDDASRPLQVGDRIVLAARREQFADVQEAVSGPPQPSPVDE